MLASPVFLLNPQRKGKAGPSSSKGRPLECRNAAADHRGLRATVGTHPPSLEGCSRSTARPAPRPAGRLCLSPPLRQRPRPEDPSRRAVYPDEARLNVARGAGPADGTSPARATGSPAACHSLLDEHAGTGMSVKECLSLKRCFSAREEGYPLSNRLTGEGFLSGRLLSCRPAYPGSLPHERSGSCPAECLCPPLHLAVAAWL
jgi:hypothetical protein